MGRVGLIPVALLTLALVACGGDGDTTGTSASVAGAANSAQRFAITDKPAATEALKPDGYGLVGPEPKPIIPDRPPPDFLAYQDLILGDGEVARPGDRVAIQYVGAEYETGRKYHSSWQWGSPYRFEVGRAGLIKGFDGGVEGMRVGGRRELIIPPALADPEGTVGGIPDRETVVYVVDLLAVE